MGSKIAWIHVLDQVLLKYTIYNQLVQDHWDIEPIFYVGRSDIYKWNFGLDDALMSHFNTLCEYNIIIYQDISCSHIMIIMEVSTVAWEKCPHQSVMENLDCLLTIQSAQSHLKIRTHSC